MERKPRAACAVLATLWLLASCASFQPSRSPTPSAGRLVRARFDPPAELVLAPGAVPMPVRELMGPVAATAGGTLWLAPRRAIVGAGGVEPVTADVGRRTVTTGMGERVAVSRRQPGLELREWRFSPRRTLALVGVLAAVAAFLVIEFEGGLEFDSTS
jgi:hypothetical protein